MYFDTHAHLDDARFDGDREALLERMRAEGIDPCMTVGANMEMNEKAVALAQRYPGPSTRRWASIPTTRRS